MATQFFIYYLLSITYICRHADISLSLIFPVLSLAISLPIVYAIDLISMALEDTE
jgi:hypothetical protein